MYIVHCTVVILDDKTSCVEVSSEEEVCYVTVSSDDENVSSQQNSQHSTIPTPRPRRPGKVATRARTKIWSPQALFKGAKYDKYRLSSVHQHFIHIDMTC